MARGYLTKQQVRQIEDAVDRVVDRAQARFLGTHLLDKRIVMTADPALTLPSLYAMAGLAEGNIPDKLLLGPILRVAKQHLEAVRSRAKAHVVDAVDAFLREAEATGRSASMEKALAGQLNDVWGKVGQTVRQIADTEGNKAKNLGIFDAIGKINAARGIDDPVVFFVVVRDAHLCGECRRLHLMPDGRPRLWRMSELKQGYHVRTDERPSISGEHPHCRCTLATLLPGFGFNAGGMVTYVGPGHDEFKRQRSL